MGEGTLARRGWPVGGWDSPPPPPLPCIPEPLSLPSLPPPCSIVSDGTVAIFMGIIMFIVPSKIPGLTQNPGKTWAGAGKGLRAATSASSTIFGRIRQSPERLV